MSAPENELVTPKHDKTAVAASFGRAAPTYDAVAHLQRKVGQRLLDYLPSQLNGPVVDMGCGTGYFIPALAARCAAPVFGLDLSHGMLSYARLHAGGSDMVALQADAEALPVRSNSVSLVFSSLAIQWCDDMTGLFAEVTRVLQPGGRFAFTTLLDGTLAELKQAWAEVDDFQHVNHFEQESVVIAAAQQAGLSMDVWQVDEDLLRYDKLSELTRELKMLGAHNVNADRPKHLGGRARVRRLAEAYENYRCQSSGRLPATYRTLTGVLKKSN